MFHLILNFFQGINGVCGFTCELVGLRQSQLGVETTFKKHLLLFSISETRNKKNF